MTKYTSLVVLFLSANIYAQPLRDINFAYLYNPDEAFAFQLKAIRDEQSFTIQYSLQVRDTSANDYSIQWEGRNLLIDKNGMPLSLNVNERARAKSGMEGQAVLPVLDAPKYLVAKVVKQSTRRAWLFYKSLESTHPVNNYLTRNGELVFDPFIRTTESVVIAKDSGQWMVSYYSEDFPAAAPAFSEGQARVSRGMKTDSIFQVRGGEAIHFSDKGIYLIQKDTNSLEGFAFRVEQDYPQYARVSNLAGPLMYICTKQEYDRLELAHGNKKAFDRVILNIAMETERARKLMRSYFRRVELANKYFTSYKEGWKTDRGMIYIIFGMPEEVYKFDDREVWNYDNDLLKGVFNFAKSSSLFDPDNYVLIRETKYKDEWYSVIDLWRNARF